MNIDKLLKAGIIMKKIILSFLSVLFFSSCSPKNLTDTSSVNFKVDSEKSTIAAEKQNTAVLEKQEQNDTASEKKVVYSNTTYGFTFELPKSWKGFSVVTDKWEGRGTTDSGKTIIETGPKISIKHPLWTSKNQRQNIPIMIFTNKQWNSIKDEKLSVSAAPIGPSILDSNDKYVFALPPRYNFDFLKGYEEVDNILKGNPLKAVKSK
jgi:hypothetical protein